MSKFCMALSFMLAMSIPVSSFADETYHYSCNGKEMKAAFPDTDHAVMDYEGELFLLKSVVSASGARYLGDGWQLWAAKDDITLTKLTKKQAETDDIPTGHEIECHQVDTDSLSP